ncbi:unnamed protein product, partial [Agarophyton chilense]
SFTAPAFIAATPLCVPAAAAPSPSLSRRRPPPRMVAYPYTGSGYGAAGIPYANDRVGQSFRQTATDDIMTTVAALPPFSTLAALLRETGLDYDLRKAGPYTLLAPFDDAFAALLQPHTFATLAPLLRPENRGDLRAVLAHHVLCGRVSSVALMRAGRLSLPTLGGSHVTLMAYNKKLSAGPARIVKTDVPCANGVMHVIGSLLLPDGFVPPSLPRKPAFVSSTVLDVYANMLTPRQALGIDPLPEQSVASSSSALAS